MRRSLRQWRRRPGAALAGWAGDVEGAAPRTASPRPSTVTEHSSRRVFRQNSREARAGSRGWHTAGSAYDSNVIRSVVRILRSAPTVLTGAVIGCTHILPEQTAYYLDGPQQKQQSEGDLPAGSKAIIVGWQNDYLRVWADNGVIAYVWKGSVVTLSDWDRKEK